VGQESRAKRLDALVSIVAASGRMIGAYERLFELFEGGTAKRGARCTGDH
jgi:hypothetical protein